MSSVRRVLLFGAGSSVHACGPLAPDLYGRMESKFAGDAQFTLIQQLKAQFPEAFKNIEYLLTMLDLGVEKEIPPFPAFDFSQTLQVRDTLMRCLVEVLSPEEIQDAAGITRNFFRVFLRQGDIILTFNQDILIEQSLWHNRQWSPKDGYQAILKYLPSLSSDVRKELDTSNQTKSKYRVLKLHGSINWKADPCTNFCQLEIFPGDFPPLLDSKPRKTVYDIIGKASREKAILAPTYLKGLNYRFLQDIWEVASQSLEQAEEIYFIGYSLPPADSLAGFLITKSLRRNGRVQKIIVVDPSENTYGRFEMCLKNSGITVPKICHVKKQFKNWAVSVSE